MTDIVFAVDVRDRTGTGGARATRREGKVPGVIYGGPLGAVPIALKLNELVRGLNQGGLLSKVIEIQHGTTRQPALIRDIQFHPVTSEPVHVDLFRVSSDQIVTVEVPVKFINEDKSPGIKRGGALSIVRHMVELECPADRIPAQLTVDLDGLEINDTVHISAIALPEGVEPKVKDRDFTIASLTGKGPSGGAEEAEGEGGEETETE